MGEVGALAPVVGREAESASIEAFVRDVPAGARALLLRGEPGIGKTTLWLHAVERCRQAGYRTLLARPAAEETAFALGGLVDLFEHEGLEPPPGDPTAEPIARGRSVLAALRRLASEQPVVVAIDDAQWLDPASARVLRFALRRLETEPVGLLTTQRPGADPLDAASTLFPERCQVVELGPLGLDALRQVLAGPVSSISRPALRRILDVSGGNPLYAIELARALGEQPDAAGALPLPDSLQAAIAGRLEAVPAGLTPLLETSSALGRTSVPALRRALPDDDVDRLLADAHARGLLVVGDDLEVRFAHPLVGSVVYGRMSPLARRALHRRLAEASTDPELRARHLARSTDEPDAEVAALLEEAAGRAGERRAVDLAAELAGHSLRLTPAGDADSARRRGLAEIAYVSEAGEVGRALALADRLVAALPPGPGRAEALVRRAQLEHDDLETGDAFLVQAVEDAGDDELLRGQVLDLLGWLRGHFRGYLAEGIGFALEALAIAERTGDPELEMSVTAGLATMSSLAGTPRPDLLERAVAIEERSGTPGLWAGPRGLVATDRRQSGDLTAAGALWEQWHADAAAAGNERIRPYTLYQLGSLECYRGNLARAEALVQEALAAARDNEDTHVEGWILYPLAFLAAWLGRPDEARSTAGRIVEWASGRGERPAVARAQSLLGLLALSEGDTATAARELTGAAARLEDMGMAQPAAIPALPDGVEALAGAGDVAGAEELLERLERQAAALDNPFARALSDRSRGVLLAARGEPDAAAPLLADAGAAFDRMGFRLEAARAVLGHGRALLRGGHRTLAADVLADARARFAGMGAVLWEARAAEELERASPGRAAGELTPAERSVAALVAAGRRNREIGQELFMSVGSVEAHLTRIYRKLDIRSRSELAALVADGTIPVAD